MYVCVRAYVSFSMCLLFHLPTYVHACIAICICVYMYKHRYALVHRERRDVTACCVLCYGKQEFFSVRRCRQSEETHRPRSRVHIPRFRHCEYRRSAAETPETLAIKCMSPGSLKQARRLNTLAESLNFPQLCNPSKGASSSLPSDRNCSLCVTCLRQANRFVPFGKKVSWRNMLRAAGPGSTRA